MFCKDRTQNDDIDVPFIRRIHERTKCFLYKKSKSTQSTDFKQNELKLMIDFLLLPMPYL